MTPQDHNKVVGVLHLIYGGMNAFGLLIGIVYMVVIGTILKDLPTRGEGFPVGIFFGIMAFMLTVFTLLFAVPPLIAGYGLLKRKAWARKAAIISSAFAAIGFPLGTCLSIYSFWFLFGQGEALYAKNFGAQQAWTPPRDALSGAPEFAGWKSATDAERERERAYVPPSQPPNWRD